MSKYNQSIDLEDERKNPPFIIEELTNFLDGGKKKTERRRKLQQIVENEKILSKNLDFWLSPTSEYERGCEKMVKLIKKIWDFFFFGIFKFFFFFFLGFFFIFELKVKLFELRRNYKLNEEESFIIDELVDEILPDSVHRKM